MKRYLIILLFSFFCCCKKKQVQNEYQPNVIPCTLSKDIDTVKFYIQGTWEWLEERRPNRLLQEMEYLTPQNQGYTLTLKLYNDTARFFKNNQPDSVYTYKIQRLTEITELHFPEDSVPVLVYYNLNNGIRAWHVPIKICSNYILLQSQYVTSIGGEAIWKRQ